MSTADELEAVELDELGGDARAEQPTAARDLPVFDLLGVGPHQVAERTFVEREWIKKWSCSTVLESLRFRHRSRKKGREATASANPLKVPALILAGFQTIEIF